MKAKYWVSGQLKLSFKLTWPVTKYFAFVGWLPALLSEELFWLRLMREKELL